MRYESNGRLNSLDSMKLSPRESSYSKNFADTQRSNSYLLGDQNGEDGTALALKSRIQSLESVVKKVQIKRT